MTNYFSQIGQDQYYIEKISKYKKGGIFLDIGANDGIYTSNTAALEFYYGWTGICIEANPKLIQVLQKNRPKSTVVNCAVWSVPGTIDLEIPLNNFKGVQGNLLSRITGLERNENYFKKHFSHETEKVSVESKTATSIILEHLLQPIVIDYASIDTEGCEIEVLKSIDFNNIDIKFMTLEHGDRPGYIEEFLKYLSPFGYKLHRINQWDVEFIK